MECCCYLHRREADPVCHREPGDGSLDPSSSEHPGPVRAQLAVQLHTAPTSHPRGLQLRQQRLLDPPGRTNEETSYRVAQNSVNIKHPLVSMGMFIFKPISQFLERYPSVVSRELNTERFP
jgi:hypothetical protein